MFVNACPTSSQKIVGFAQQWFSSDDFKWLYLSESEGSIASKSINYPGQSWDSNPGDEGLGSPHIADKPWYPEFGSYTTSRGWDIVGLDGVYTTLTNSDAPGLNAVTDQPDVGHVVRMSVKANMSLRVLSTVVGTSEWCHWGYTPWVAHATAWAKPSLDVETLIQNADYSNPFIHHLPTWYDVRDLTRVGDPVIIGDCDSVIVDLDQPSVTKTRNDTGFIELIWSN